MYYCPISTILKVMTLELAAQKIFMLFVGKKASTLSTLYGITNENGTTTKTVSSNQCSHLTAVSPTTTFGQV